MASAATGRVIYDGDGMTLRDMFHRVRHAAAKRGDAPRLETRGVWLCATGRALQMWAGDGTMLAKVWVESRCAPGARVMIDRTQFPLFDGAEFRPGKRVVLASGPHGLEVNGELCAVSPIGAPEMGALEAVEAMQVNDEPWLEVPRRRTLGVLRLLDDAEAESAARPVKTLAVRVEDRAGVATFTGDGSGKVFDAGATHPLKGRRARIDLRRLFAMVKASRSDPVVLRRAPTDSDLTAIVIREQDALHALMPLTDPPEWS